MPCLLHSSPADTIHSLPVGKAGSGFKRFHANSSERTGRLCCLESSCCFKTPSLLDSWEGQQLHVPHSFTPERRLFSSLPAIGLSSCSRAVGIPTPALDVWSHLLTHTFGIWAACRHTSTAHVTAVGMHQPQVLVPKKPELAQIRWEPAMVRVHFHFKMKLQVDVFSCTAGGRRAAQSKEIPLK